MLRIISWYTLVLFNDISIRYFEFYIQFSLKSLDIIIYIVLKPTAFSCFILRIGVSLSLTLCLSALFTKTNRLSRIFNSSVKKLRQTSYVSPKSQLVICFSIIGVEVIGLIVWVLLA